MPATGPPASTSPRPKSPRAMATAAKRVFILADHAKIGLTSRVGFCPVERIDTLITDARAEGSEGLAALRARITTVVVA